MISIGFKAVSALTESLGLFGSKRPDLPPSKPGPELSRLQADWIPQGQVHDTARGEVLTTYNMSGSGVLVSVQDKDALAGELAAVMLGGYQPSMPEDVDGADRHLYARAPVNGPPTKGGGIAIHDGIVYVADTKGVFLYSLDDIHAAAGACPDPGQDPAITVPAIGYQQTDHFNNASFITIQDGYAYVGQFSVDRDGIGGSTDYPKSGALTRFEIADDGRFINPAGPIEAPAYAQGVAVTEQGLFYTTSYGSNPADHEDPSPNALVYQPFEDFESFTVAPGSADSPVEVMTLDYYAEEFSIVDGEVWVTYESNANPGGSNGTSSIFPERYESNIGELPENESIRRYSVQDLDLSRTNITLEQLEAAFGS